jgi:Mrp family chromosome partitioning ATPase
MANASADDVRNRLAKLRVLRAAGAPARDLATVLQSPVLVELLGRLDQAGGTADAARVAELRQAIDREVASRTASLESETRTFQAQIGAVEERLNELRRAAGESARGTTVVREFARRLANLNGTYEALTRQRQELLEQSQTAEPDLSILSLAESPDRPSSLSGLFLIPPATVAFGLLGCMIALVRDRMDDTIRGERDLVDSLRVPCAGLVPEFGERRGARVSRARTRARSAFSKGIRCVFASSVPLCGVRAQKVLLVTSSGPAEGKTTLAWGLAVTAASVERRVALLDFSDGAAPPAEMIGTDTLASMDVPEAADLLHQRPLSDAMRYIPNAGLSYLNVRTDATKWLSLLAAPQFAEMFERLREDYDLVVIDAPAVLDRPEVGLLAAKADKILFAVRWGRTKRDAAVNAVGLIESADCAEGDGYGRISAVLTRVNVKQHLRYGFVDRGDTLAAARV